jgi:hypothetical protein
VVCDNWTADQPEVTVAPSRSAPAWLDPDGTTLYRDYAHFLWASCDGTPFTSCRRVLVLY